MQHNEPSSEKLCIVLEKCLICAMPMPMLHIKAPSPGHTLSHSVSQSGSQPVSHSSWLLEPSNGRRPSVDCASLLMPNCAPAFVEFGFCNLLSMPPSQLLQTRLGLHFAVGAAEAGIKNELGVTGGCRSRSRADDGDGNVIFAKSFRLF